MNRLRTSPGGKGLYFQVVIPSPCAGNIMGPGGETIKAIGYRTGAYGVGVGCRTWRYEGPKQRREKGRVLGRWGLG